MALEIIKPNKPISENDIESFENRFKLKIPKDFRDFLLKTNGGIPEEKILDFQDHYIDDYLKVMEFFSLEKIADFFESIEEEGLNNSNDLFLMYSKYYKYKMLIIGEFYDNLFLCISYSEDNFGKIYYSDHEHEDDFSPICDSFTEFIEGFEYSEN